MVSRSKAQLAADVKEGTPVIRRGRFCFFASVASQ